MNFDCKIEKITKDSVMLRFWSEKTVELHLSHATFLPIDDKDNVLPVPRLYLDNDYKFASYKLPKREVKKLRVIALDATFHEQYSLIFHLDTHEVEKSQETL